MDIFSSNGMLLAKSEVAVNTIGGDGTAVDGMVTGEGTMVDPMGAVKDPLLSSWPFVIGISTVVLTISVVIGVLLAKRKIKKGIELYED
ncbi:MAG: putative rane protein [Firmicutes bacterium]|nr:putative rane protein [Bacillota bacterium]